MDINSNFIQIWPDLEEVACSRLILKLAGEYFSNFRIEKTEDFHDLAFLDLYRHLHPLLALY